MRLGEHSEPQPGVDLVRPGTRGIPRIDDVLLLVEVADATVESDRRIKLPPYAQAGVREVWPVDLRHDVVEVHRDPDRSGYQSVRVARRGESIAAEALPDRRVAVSDMLPEPS